jgi:hypothetical protein
MDQSKGRSGPFGDEEKRLLMTGIELLSSVGGTESELELFFIL